MFVFDFKSILIMNFFDSIRIDEKVSFNIIHHLIFHT